MFHTCFCACVSLMIWQSFSLHFHLYLFTKVLYELVVFMFVAQLHCLFANDFFNRTKGRNTGLRWKISLAPFPTFLAMMKVLTRWLCDLVFNITYTYFAPQCFVLLLCFCLNVLNPVCWLFCLSLMFHMQAWSKRIIFIAALFVNSNYYHIE